MSNFEQLPTQPSNQRMQPPQRGAPVQGYWVLTGEYRDCRVSAAEMRLKPVYRWVPNCMCAQCLPRIKRALSGLFEMVLCPTCGNKRCPHANDHRHACTGSNEPGQPGSRY